MRSIVSVRHLDKYLISECAKYLTCSHPMQGKHVAIINRHYITGAIRSPSALYCRSNRPKTG